MLDLFPLWSFHSAQTFMKMEIKAIQYLTLTNIRRLNHVNNADFNPF